MTNQVSRHTMQVQVISIVFRDTSNQVSNHFKQIKSILESLEQSKVSKYVNVDVQVDLMSISRAGLVWWHVKIRSPLI